MEYLFIGGPWDGKKLELSEAQEEILAPNSENPDQLYQYRRHQYKVIGKGIKEFYALNGMKGSEIENLLYRPLIAFL